MRSEWVRVVGVVQAGHGVASGMAANSPYPAGTITLQTPVFRTLGLDLSLFFPGTLNISIAPHRFILHQPDHYFRQVAWTDRHPPEDFSFVACHLHHREIAYEGLIYYPHPETKQVHFQNPSVLEVLSPWIEGIRDGDRLELDLRTTALRVWVD
jgi:hypothetical protein